MQPIVLVLLLLCLNLTMTFEVVAFQRVPHRIPASGATVQLFEVVSTDGAAGLVLLQYDKRIVFMRLGVVPRVYTNLVWSATCTGVAFTPDQISDLSKLLHADLGHEEKIKLFGHYLKVRHLWPELGTRPYVF